VYRNYQVEPVKTNNRIRLATTLLAIAFCAGCSAVQTASNRNNNSDEAISARLRVSYAQDAYFRGDPISVTTSDGVVILSGNVGSGNERKRAEAIANVTPGVEAVENNLKVK
jgi:osmotically-inducible protein OsmY